jgi:hypothetical protein
MDAGGSRAEYIYTTDVIVLPDNARALKHPDVLLHGWMPELIGGEWLEESDGE